MGLTKEPVDASGDSPAPSILRAGRGMGSKGTGPAGVRALGHTCKGGLCPEESAGASPQGCRRGAPGKIPPTLSPAHPSAQVCGQGGKQQARPPCCWGDRSPGPSPSAPSHLTGTRAASVHVSSHTVLPAAPRRKQHFPRFAHFCASHPHRATQPPEAPACGCRRAARVSHEDLSSQRARTSSVLVSPGPPAPGSVLAPPGRRTAAESADEWKADLSVGQSRVPGAGGMFLWLTTRPGRRRPHQPPHLSRSGPSLRHQRDSSSQNQSHSAP